MILNVLQSSQRWKRTFTSTQYSKCSRESTNACFILRFLSLENNNPMGSSRHKTLQIRHFKISQKLHCIFNIDIRRWTCRRNYQQNASSTENGKWKYIDHTFVEIEKHREGNSFTFQVDFLTENKICILTSFSLWAVITSFFHFPNFTETQHKLLN